MLRCCETRAGLAGHEVQPTRVAALSSAAVLTQGSNRQAASGLLEHKKRSCRRSMRAIFGRREFRISSVSASSHVIRL